MAHTKHTIELVCTLRKDGLSYGKIGKQLNLTKNQVLGIAYKHLLKIDRHVVYADKSKDRDGNLPEREHRPSVAFVIGLNDTRFYVVSNRRVNL